MKLFAGLVLTLVSISAIAFQSDVKPNKLKLLKGDVYVKVTKVSGGYVRFQRCEKTSELDETCSEKIGPKMLYSVQELDDRYHKEIWEVIGAGAADLGVGALTVLTGGGTVVAFSSGSGVMTALGMMFTYLGVETFNNIPKKTELGNAINPYEQFKQADTLNPAIINDLTVAVPADEMELFISRLEVVLNKLSDR